MSTSNFSSMSFDASGEDRPQPRRKPDISARMASRNEVKELIESLGGSMEELEKRIEEELAKGKMTEDEVKECVRGPRITSAILEGADGVDTPVGMVFLRASISASEMSNRDLVATYVLQGLQSSGLVTSLVKRMKLKDDAKSGRANLLATMRASQIAASVAYQMADHMILRRQYFSQSEYMKMCEKLNKLMLDEYDRSCVDTQMKEELDNVTEEES